MKELAKRAVARSGWKISRVLSPHEEAFAALRRLLDIDRRLLTNLETAFLTHCIARFSDSHGMQFQDLFVDFVLPAGGGVFCEFGAADGMTTSNSFYLERHRGWSGVLAEPARRWHPLLEVNRPTTVFDRRCVFSRSGLELEFAEAEFGELSTLATYRDSDYFARERRRSKVYTVATISLDDLLEDHGLAAVDYISVDTEGSELEILTAFDFARFAPKVLTIEHNYTPHRAVLLDLLTKAGYSRMFEAFSRQDDWYVRNDLVASIDARTAS